MKRNNKFFSMLYVVLCLAFFYLPILVTMIFSFNSSKSLTRFTGFSLRWYQELLGNGEVICICYHCDHCDHCFYNTWNHYSDRFIQIKEGNQGTAFEY